jgi:hypothetical protein
MFDDKKPSKKFRLSRRLKYKDFLAIFKRGLFILIVYSLIAYGQTYHFCSALIIINITFPLVSIKSGFVFFMMLFA